MKVGLFLTNQQYLDTDMVTALDEQISMVHLARDAGWDSVFSGQHYLNEGNNKQLQIVPFLARLMAEAGGMTTGLGVLILPLHNPVYVAETVATLDIIAKGNFIFGVGLGYREIEFDAFRVPKGQRVRRFEETLELVKALLRGDVVTHDSDQTRLENVRMNIRPVQSPHPPIWIAANSDKAILRAARMADAWFVNPHAPIETIRRQMKLYRGELERLGKSEPSEIPMIKEVFCAKDRNTAIATAGRWLSGKYKDYARWGQDEVMEDDDSFDKEFEELARDRFVLGSPEECFQQLRRYRDEMGMNHLIIRTHWAGMPAEDALGSMRLISDELLPELRKL